jgi:FKBP-type peptidyl-prolyl cis-trans isomerase SlyD
MLVLNIYIKQNHSAFSALQKEEQIMNYILFMKQVSIVCILCTVLIISTVRAETAGSKSMPAVTDGKNIFIEYTLKLEDGEVVDTNVGSAPMTFIQGKGQIVPGLEKELTGMKKGESKQVVVKPEDGYGKIRDNAIREVPKEKIPKEAHKAGEQIQGRTARGKVIPLTVKEVKEKTIVLDYNHPLAGKTLYFDVKIVDIKDPSQTAPATN